ncbi:MAG: hypothetical protein C5B55_10290 [Blastocatellia bacterium]|nr:MAG: hypothetical protein C5B55_10290 [Blastocatellia bacterium]
MPVRRVCVIILPPLRQVLLITFSIICAVSLTSAQQTKESNSPRVDAVWKREELYWQYVKAGDVETYRTLWDENFRGWPCKNQHTATKSEIGNWVRDIRDQKAKLTYSLTFDGAADFGDVVVVYYKTPMMYEYSDGRVVDKDKVFKFTHTWHKTGDTWLIIGGMCGEIPSAK